MTRLERFVEALGQPPGIELVEASGRGGIRQPIAGSRGYWLPMSWSLHLVPGSEFVFLARARLAPPSPPEPTSPRPTEAPPS